MYKPYIEAPYLAPVFTSKPIIITLPCSEANPHKMFSQTSISFQLFSQKSHQSQSTGMCTYLRLIPDNLVERASFYHVVRGNNLKYFVISRNIDIKCFTYWISSNKYQASNKHCTLICTALLGAQTEISTSPLISTITQNVALIIIVTILD